MPFPITYKMFLRTAISGDYYFVDGNGAVVTTSNPTPLQHLPADWDELVIPVIRSNQNLGLLTQVTSTYNFVLDGAKILRHINNTQGTAAECYIEVWKTESTNQTYFLQYAGQFMFTTWKDDGTFVEIDIEQGGLNAALYREKDTVYEIPLNDDDSDEIYLDGVALRNDSLVRMLTPLDGTREANTITPAVTVSSSESKIGVSIVERPKAFAETQINIKNDYPFFVAKVDGAVNIKYDIAVNLQPTQGMASVLGTWGILIYHSNGGTTIQTYTLYQETISSSGPWGTKTANGTLSISVNEGDQLSILSGWETLSGNPAYNLYMDWTKGIVDVSYNTRQDPTTTRAYKYAQVIEKLIARIDPTATIAPNVFNTPSPGYPVLDFMPYDLYLIPSEAVRGILNAKYKIAWKDILKDLPRYGLGASVDGDNILTIRPVNYFFIDSLLADLGPIEKVKTAPALKYLFSSLKVGAKAGDNDALQGRYEINAPQLWQITKAKVEGDFDMVSPFISGMYAFEQIRSDRVKDTTNLSDDNRILLLDTMAGTVAGQPAIVPARQQLISGNYANGLIDTVAEQTAFNLSQSPARDILRNSAVMAVQNTYPSNPSQIAFVSAEREGTMTSKLGVGPITERTNLTITGAPFKPVLFQFEAPAPIGFYEAFQADPNRYLQFYDENNILQKGFIDEIKIKPGGDGDPGKLECSLLAHPATDLTTLTY